MNFNTAMLGMLLAMLAFLGFMGVHWGPPEQRHGLPAVISTQELASRTIRDATSDHCFAVVQQDGQPRFVPVDCPKSK